MGRQGRNGSLTLPADVRQQLDLRAGAELEVEVTADGAVTLRPVIVAPSDDPWAYTAEQLAGIARALEDVRAGRAPAAADADLATYDE